MKKVRCINNDRWKKQLTIGKVYEVFYQIKNLYVIIGDDGEITICDQNRFEEVKEVKVKKTRFVGGDTYGDFFDWYNTNLEDGQEYVALFAPIPEGYRLATKADIGKKGKFWGASCRGWIDAHIINDSYTYIVEKEPEVKELTMAELETHFGCKVKVVK